MSSSSEQSHLDHMVRGYVDAATWADLDRGDGREFGSEAYEFGVADLDVESAIEVERVVETFMMANLHLLRQYEGEIEVTDGDDPFAWAGHDLYLTSVGHGTGFWDRRMDELGKQLTAAAKEVPEVQHVWLDADGETVHIDY